MNQNNLPNWFWEALVTARQIAQSGNPPPPANYEEKDIANHCRICGAHYDDMDDNGVVVRKHRGVAATTSMLRLLKDKLGQEGLSWPYDVMPLSTFTVHFPGYDSSKDNH